MRYLVLGAGGTGGYFGGRLAEYRYYDMHQAIAAALQTVGRLLGKANVADDLAA